MYNKAVIKRIKSETNIKRKKKNKNKPQWVSTYQKSTIDRSKYDDCSVKGILHLTEFPLYARRFLSDIVVTQLTRCKLEIKKPCRVKNLIRMLIEMLKKFFFYLWLHLIEKKCYVQKQSLWHRCFPVNFAKFLRNIFYRKPPGDYFCTF